MVLGLLVLSVVASDNAPTLTAGRGGCVVPNSQIDMVVKGDEDDRDRWFVCGDIAPGPGNAARPIGLHVVVRKDDVIARGHATRDFGRWRFEVVPDGDGQLTVGWAIASAVAIVEKENPPGLETLTWVQRVEVMEARGTDQPFEFPAAELTVTKQGEVLNDRAVSSSLAILEEPRPGGFHWEQVLEIRRVVEATG
jgi:hypothetical protein